MGSLKVETCAVNRSLKTYLCRFTLGIGAKLDYRTADSNVMDYKILVLSWVIN